MLPSKFIRPTHSMPPPMPPMHVVDLMADAGSAVFGAVWRAKQARLVECPALSDARPAFKSTYDIEPMPS